MKNHSKQTPQEVSQGRDEFPNEIPRLDIAEDFFAGHERQANDDLVKDFLKGEHMVKDFENDFVSDDDVDSNNLHGSP